MATKVKGSDIIVWAFDGTDWKPVACSTSCELTVNADLNEITTESSGAWKEFRYKRLSWQVTVDNVIILDDAATKFGPMDLLERQINFLDLLIQFSMTDGTLTKVFTGKALVPSNVFTGAVDDFGRHQVVLQGTGEFTIGNELGIPSIEIEVPGSGLGQITSITLLDPSTGVSYTLPGAVTIGNTYSWLMDGLGANPEPGTYQVTAIVVSDQLVNTFTIDAPPTISVSPGGGTTNLNSAPFGAVLLDFTTSRTIRFRVGPLPNVAPVANAGPDQTITLPTNSVTVSGSGSTDSDGTIVSYLWSHVSGPGPYTIVTAALASTVITGLAAGTYVFQLTVTDDDGATGTDTVTITVNPPTPKITVEVVTSTGGTGYISSIFLVVPGGDFYAAGPITVGTTYEWLLDGVGGNPAPGLYEIVAFVSTDQATNTFSTDAAPGATKSVPGPISPPGPVGAPFAYPGTVFTFLGSETITFDIGS